jgi:hypothetical protein
MSSTKSPKAMVRDGSAVVGAMLTAVRNVTSQDFFAVTEPCDSPIPGARRSASGCRGSRSVREGPLAGSCPARCRTSSRALCSTPSQDATRRADSSVHGRRSDRRILNMVCGAWLSYLRTPQTFTLSRPVVEPAAPPFGRDEGRLAVTVNDLPLAIGLTVHRPPVVRA